MHWQHKRHGLDLRFPLPCHGRENRSCYLRVVCEETAWVSWGVLMHAAVANECGLPDMETFTQGLQNDYEAVKTSLLLPYSNGPVEGQVNRLKFVKRSMFGRGSFELLRNRFLEAA